jgi:hypothetical protein
MKNFILIFFLITACSSNAFSESLKLEDLQTPSSPAFTLLGIDPSTVPKIQSPREFILNYQSLAQESDSSIPRNFAVTFSPYWWFPHPDISFTDYLLTEELVKKDAISVKGNLAPDNSGKDKISYGDIENVVRSYDLGNNLKSLDNVKSLKERKKIGKNLGPVEKAVQHLTISLGTTDLTNIDDERDGTVLGAGIRLPILRGKPRNTDEILKKTTEAYQNFYNVLVSEVKRFPEEVINTDNDPFFNKEDVHGDFEQLLGYDDVPDEWLEKSYTKARDAFVNTLNESEKDRIGYQLEFASAITYAFEDDKTDDSDLDRAGFWATGGYIHGNGTRQNALMKNIGVLGVARYLYDNRESDNEKHNFDVGGRVLFTFNNTDLTLSGEFVHRFIDGDDDTNRYGGIAEYKIQDQLYLYASIGKGFEDDTNDERDLLSIFGVRFAFGDGAAIDPTDFDFRKQAK